jgi:iron complex outermembrane receptor protein
MTDTADGRRRAGNIGVVSSLLLLSFGGLVSAQDTGGLAAMEIEDLMKVEVQSVSGASKFLQKVIDAPAAVSVVTAHDIDTYGYRTLAAIIASVPGFNVTSDRNYSYVGVRGFQRPGDYNSRVLVLLDGHRLNDPVYNMAYLGNEFPVDVELIDRVELIRGPSSSLYGTNAFLAVINVVTKKGRALQGMQVSGDAGSLRAARGRVAFGASFDQGAELLVSASRQRSSGQPRLYYAEYDDPATNNGVAEDLDGESDYNLFGSLSFKGLSFQGLFGSRAKRVPTASFDSWFNDPTLETNDAQGWADLRYDRKVASWQLTARAYYDWQEYRGLYPTNDSPTAEPSISVFSDLATAGWWGTEIVLGKTLGERHKVTVGAEYRHNFRLNQANSDVASGVIFLDDRRSSRDSAVFVEDQFTITDKLLVNAGIRTDRYHGFGMTTNPRVALIYKPAEKTAIKALWGTAFRAPNAYELYFSSYLYKPNPNLEPETVRTGELVVERYFSDRYRVMANVSTSRVRGLISHIEAPDGLLEFFNLDAANTRGVAAEFEGKWGSGIATRASYSYHHARNLVADTPLVNSASQLATLNVMVPFLNQRAFAGMDVHYVGPVRTLDGSFTDPFVVPNLTLTLRPLGSRLGLTASVYNLFDNRYGYPAGDEHRQNIIRQDGRTFRVGATYLWRLAK